MQPIAGLDKLLAALPADSFDRVTAALARVADGEFRLAAVRSRGLAVLDSTIKRLDAFAKALANVARVPSANQRRATSPNPAAPAPFAPHPKATEPPDWKAIAANADKMGATIEAAFQRGVTALRGFVAVADPSAFSTLAASLNILSAEVGTVFLPYVEAASRQVQAAASWFRNLDDATKTTFARIALAGLALGGFVVVWRTLASVVAFARVAIVTTYAAMAATPLGAIAALVGVVGTLAAAWWGVNAAARAAGGAQGEAGRAGVGAGGAQPDRDFTPDEIAAMPKEYQDRFAALTRERQAVQTDQKIDETARQNQLESNDRARANLSREFARNVQAQRSLFPADVRARIEKEPDKAAEIAAEFRQEQERKLAERQKNYLADLQAMDAGQGRRQKAVDEAGAEKAVQFELIRQAQNYGARNEITGTGAQAKAMLGDTRSAEFRQMLATMRKAVEEKAPGETFTDAELTAVLGVRAPNPNLPNAVEFATGKLPPRPEAKRELDAQIRGLQTSISLTDLFTKALNPKGDDFAANFKPPIQSRFTDAIAFQESAQLAVLNTADADAKLLQIQMRNLTQAVGDVTKVIQDYAAAQQRGAADTYLRGWIDLSR